MKTKIRETVKGKVIKFKDAARNLWPGATSRPSSRISTRPTTPIPNAESNLPIGTEERRLVSAPIAAGEGAYAGPSGASRLPATATCALVADAVIIYIAATIPWLLPTPSPLTPSSASTSRPDLVSSPTIPLDSAPSVSPHEVNTLTAETLPISITISSPPAFAPIVSRPPSPDTALVPATPNLDDGADPAPEWLVAEQNTAKPASKIDQWWLANRKGVISGVKTVLKLASKVLEDVPAGGAIAANVLDSGVEALENVQVMVARQ
jgi:hypothetical protein